MPYSYLGGFTQNSGVLTTFTQNVSVPAGFCVVAVYVQNATAVSVTVGGTLLNQDLFDSGTDIGIFSGVVGSSSSVVITGGVVSQDMTFGIWSWPDDGTFESSFQTIGFGGELAVSSGDYLFAISETTSNFSGSIQTPSNAGPGTPYQIMGVNRTITVADWTVVSTNAVFSISTGGEFVAVAAADYTPSVSVGEGVGSAAGTGAASGFSFITATAAPVASGIGSAIAEGHTIFSKPTAQEYCVEAFPFGISRSRLIWDNLIKRYGDLALLRQPTLPDRFVSYMPANFTAMERLGRVSNPADRKALISELDPCTGLPISPEPSERDVLVTLLLNDDGSPILDEGGNVQTDELLKIVAPPARVGTSRKLLYWRLQVRA